MYTVTVDARRRLIRVAAEENATAEALEQLDRDLKAQIVALRAGAPNFDVLMDLRRSPTLPQALATTVQESMRWLADNGMRRTAFLVAGMVKKMQLDRLAANSNFACFQAEEEALAWLAS